MTDLCGFHGCTYDESAHRPYARKRDMPSVSTISSLIDNGKARSFAWSAAGIAATIAVHQGEQWANLGTQKCGHTAKDYCPACRFIRSEHDRQWKEKALLGSHIHHCALQWAKGYEVVEDDTTKGYLDALEKFTIETSPKWLWLEFTVRNERPVYFRYRGQCDAIAMLTINGNRSLWLIDLKTGGFYPAEQTLQLAAYAYAQYMTDWSDGTEKLVRPVPLVAHKGVLLLAADGTYRLQDLPAHRQAFNTFLSLRAVWNWEKEIAKWAKDLRIIEEIG